MIKHILLYIIIIFFNSSLWGQELDNKMRASLSKNDRDTLQLHFRFKSSLLEKEYFNNSSTLESINTLFSDNAYLSKLDSISIYATTSPDGVLEYNSQLAYERSMAIRGYLRWRYPELKKLTISTRSEVYKWSELISYVEQDSTIQYKNSVLEILQNNENHTRATIEWRLKNIDNGAVWRHIVKYYLRFLRSGVTVINLYTHNTIAKVNAIQVDIPKINTIVNEVKMAEQQEVKVERERVVKPLFALKTNLLFNAVSLINIELEVPIGKRWSIAGEWIFPWWITKDNANALQLLSGNIEGKYWFGERSNRDVMTGWFAGIYAGGGLYDLQYSGKGYQGEFYIAAGLGGGYAHTINKKGNLRMEYSLGIGYLQTHYRYYEGQQNNELLVWKNNGRYSWIGPTRAKVSLVWMININKRGGIR